MNKRNMGRWAVGALVIGGFLGSCSDSDCALSNTAYTCMKFYGQNGSSVTFNGTVTVTAAGTDSVLINQESSPSQFLLPLSYTHQEDTFIVQFTERMRDSIFVSHENIPHFISMDCGAGMYHSIQAVRSTNNAIDSVTITNPSVDYETKENIKLYFTLSL